jgi:adenylate kinase family enzyme
VQRVAVIGMPGAGKSTLALELGRALGAPVHHLDAIYWKPGWVASSWDEFREKHDELIAGDRWVLDGNYTTGGVAERLDRADTIVVVMAPRWLALTRVIRRWLRHRGSTRPDLGEGRPERISLEFLGWAWNWNREHPEFINTLQQHAPGKPIVVLRTRREATELIGRARAEHPRSRRPGEQPGGETPAPGAPPRNR